MGRAEHDLIRDGYAAFARGDFDWIRERVHPEFELHTIFVGTGNDVYRGPDALARYAADMADAWDEWRQEVADVLDAGDEVVAIIDITARGRGSGMELQQRFALVWEFRDGRIVRGRSFANVSDGLRAAGLAP